MKKPQSIPPAEIPPGSGPLPKGTSARDTGPRRGNDGKFSKSPTMHFGGGAGTRSIKKSGLKRYDPI